MQKLLLRSLLALVFYANPAAACDYLFMPDIEALTKCVKSQQFTISHLERQISLLLRTLDAYERSLDSHSKSIERLSDRVFELRAEMAILKSQKAKPASK